MTPGMTRHHQEQQLLRETMERIREKTAEYIAQEAIAKAAGRDEVLGWPVVRGGK